MLLQDQEIYTLELVRLRLNFGGRFMARLVSDGCLVTVEYVSCGKVLATPHLPNSCPIEVFAEELKSL